MAFRSLLLAAVTSGAVAMAAPVSADCPMTTPSVNGVTLTPVAPGQRLEQPKVGDHINVAIPLPASGGTVANLSACFDDVVVTLSLADPKTPGQYVFTVPVVANASVGPLPIGDHTLAVQWTYDKVSEADKGPKGDKRLIVFKPALDSVHVGTISKANKSFRVELVGDGFDESAKDNNRIVMEDLDRNVCWTGTTGCASPNGIRGSVSPHLIVLESVDPGEEATSRFKVCYRSQSDERCSVERPDDTKDKHWYVLATSVGVLIVIALIVYGLIRIGRKVFMIWGKRYVLSVLLLDKETNTYSLSKLQFYIWTAVAVFGYAYLTTSRFWVQHWIELPPIPSGLPGIVGISAGTAVGAQVVTQVNGPKGSGQLYPSLSDLITTGDVVAAERVQFLVWTIIGAVGFLLAIANLDPRTIADLPDVPSSILTISGISAFGYLGGKMARDPGPVINEVIVGAGPDPEVVPPVAGSAAPASVPTPAWLQTIQTAAAAINTAKQKLSGVTGSPSLAAVLTPATAAINAGVSTVNDAGKLTVASTLNDLNAARVATDTHVAEADKGVNDAVRAKEGMSQASASAADFAAALNAASLAQTASKGVQDIQAALKTATPATPVASSSPQFGVIELRGRMLSQDATFKLSIHDDANADDFPLTFDRLEPSPKDDTHVQKPRVVERDPDTSDNTLAKRLQLVVKLDDKTSQFFVAKSTHTITVTSPDSQKAVFKFQVPDSQRPS